MPAPDAEPAAPAARMWNRTRLCLALFLLSFAVFAARVRNGGTGDTIPAQLLPISILLEGNLDFNEFVCPTDPATNRAIDYAADRCTAPLNYYFDVANGRVVSRYPIIPGIMNLPLHAVGYVLRLDVVGLRSEISVLTSALISAGSVVLMFLLLEALGCATGTALSGALVYAFGTVVWSVNGHGLWQHGPSLLLLNGALLLLARGGADDGADDGTSSRGMPWAGLLLGFAVFNRPTNILLAVPLALYVAVHHRHSLLRFCLLAAIPAALMLLYSHVVLGSVVTLGQGQTMRFSAQPWVGLAGLLFSPARGLFVFSPILLLALLQLRPVLTGAPRNALPPHPLARYLTVATIGLIALYACWPLWWGGVTFGYRLVGEALPAFIVLLAFAWESTIRASRPWKGVAAVLLLLSVWFNFLGAQVAPCGFDTSPDSIDYHPERLWQVRGTELLRCTRMAGASLGITLGE